MISGGGAHCLVSALLRPKIQIGILKRHPLKKLSKLLIGPFFKKEVAYPRRGPLGIYTCFPLLSGTSCSSKQFSMLKLPAEDRNFLTKRC